MEDTAKPTNHHQINELESNAEVFRFMLSDMPQALYLWKPMPDKWCILEVLCHLYDEEREDFRARIRHLFEKPAEPMPSINPETWVSERNYLSQNFSEKLINFLSERADSVRWLKSLVNPDWKTSQKHESFGSLSAEMLLANWLAHDYLHIRQILNLKFEYLKHISDMPMEYSGDWR